MSVACRQVVQTAREMNPRVTTNEALELLRKQRISPLPPESTIKREFARVDERRTYALKKARAKGDVVDVIELPLAGGELLAAAETETGGIAALTTEVVKIAERAIEASDGQTPAKDIERRNANGQFTDRYNRARRRKRGEQIASYLRTEEEKATVLRLSCVFGPHQIGTEDQSWVAWVLVRELDGAAVTIHGDGRQVRDVLYVDDVVDALIRAWSQTDQVRGRAFNIGGGPSSALSLLELLDLVAHLRGQRPATRFEDWREGAQRYFVSDPRAFMATTGWRPRVLPRTGIEALDGWLLDSRTPVRA